MWVRMGPSDEFWSEPIAEPMTLGHYKDSNPRPTPKASAGVL
jgi:hypothetical protein